MAQVVITISDETPGQAISLSLEFTPAVKTRGEPGLDHDPQVFMENNPMTHIAAYLAWQAIDEFMGTEPTVQTIKAPIEI